MTLYLIDASAIFHRAYHSYPPMLSAEGKPVNAIYGMTDILWAMLDKFRVDATHLGMVFDAPGPNFRHKLYPEYKANRKAKDADLVSQFQGVRDAVQAFNLPCIERAGYEADDVLATLAAQAFAEKIKTVIISSDKDLMQLIIDGHIEMYCPMQNKSMGVHAVFEKFGVAPGQVTDVQALMGDSTDNVPGVPSIGVKGAAALIQRYGNLENLLANAESVEKAKTRKMLLENKHLAELSKKLVTLDKSVPLLENTIESLAVRAPKPGLLYDFLSKMDFQLLLSRLEQEALQ
jgi:DNA polymerase-1